MWFLNKEESKLNYSFCICKVSLVSQIQDAFKSHHFLFLKVSVLLSRSICTALPSIFHQFLYIYHLLEVLNLTLLYYLQLLWHWNKSWLLFKHVWVKENAENQELALQTNKLLNLRDVLFIRNTFPHPTATSFLCDLGSQGRRL